MGCVYSKGNGQIELLNELGKPLLGTSRTDEDLNSVLIYCSNENIQLASKGYINKLYNEGCLSHGQESVMLRALGVSEILVKFEEKPRKEKEKILRYLYLNWEVLQHHSSVIEALKETKFVSSADGKLYKPKDLFDPRDPLLKSLFSRKYPAKRFVSEGWLNILTKTGLQNTRDAHVVLECARRVEFLGAQCMKPLVPIDKEDYLNMKAEVSLEIWSLAKTLVSVIFENFDVLNVNNFCNILGEIACIPAGEGYPYESGKEGGRRVLCSYSKAILFKDWPLAWSAAPILYGVQPAGHSLGALQLKSPPPFTTVLKHLQRAFHTDSSWLIIEEATFEVFQYLDTIWDTLSPFDIATLEEIPFIPVANRTHVASPACIFPSLTIDIFPLGFELPSLYLPFMKILKDMKLQERLSISSAMFLLSNLHKYSHDKRLFPNDLRAVLKTLHFLYNEITEHENSDRSDWESLLFVPDEGCRLIHASSCLYIDAYGFRYLKHIDTSKLRFVHHDLPERLCLAFGIRKLSDVVVEELDCGDHHLQPLEEIGSVSLAVIKKKLLSRSFQVAISKVFNAVSNTTTGSSFQTLQGSLESVSQRLQFVKCIYTRFWLLPKSLDITRVSLESMIPEWESGSHHRGFYYVDRSNTLMLIAEPPSYVSVLDLVAAVVSHVLGSPVPLPISSLFLCPQDYEVELVDVLKLSYDKRVRTDIDFLGTEKGFPFESVRNAVLLKDCPLAIESLVPSEGALQLKNPPPFTVVLKHLQAKGSCLLTTVESSLVVLNYLNHIWPTLSHSDILELKQVAFIAADNGAHLVSPSSLFVHLSMDLSPLAYKLPPCYLPFLKMLKQLGSEDILSISSAINLLSNFRRSCGYRRLNPNELHAVVEILHFVCNETIDQQTSDSSNWKSELVVPDDGCRLVHAYLSVYIDPYGSQFVKFIDSSKLRFVHHNVSQRLCSAFGIRKLSDIVVEELDCVENLETIEKIGSVSLAHIKQKLLSWTFQVALSRVLDTVSSNTPGSENPSFQTLQESLGSVSQRLQFVECIYTRFWLLPEYLDITRVSKVSEWESGSCHRSLYYVDSSNTCMLIADPPSYVSVIDLVALVVSHALGFPVPLPIASLFFCPRGSETTLIDVLKLSNDERVTDSVGSGIDFLGRELYPEDAKKDSYYRLGITFYRGEIVAWRNRIGEDLKYGRIPEDVIPPERQSFYRFNVETFQGKTKSIISSLIYTFTKIPVGNWYATHGTTIFLKDQYLQKLNLEHGGVPAADLVQAVEEMLSSSSADAGKLRYWQQKKLAQLKQHFSAKSASPMQ